MPTPLQIRLNAEEDRALRELSYANPPESSNASALQLKPGWKVDQKRVG